jgi:hypothetical protein
LQGLRQPNIRKRFAAHAARRPAGLAARRRARQDSPVCRPSRIHGFRATLGADVTTVKLPAKSPNLNAFAERFVLSIKSECLNHVPLGERHLRLLVTEFVEHYHVERTHQGSANALIVQRAATVNGNARVHRRKRIRDMLSYYHRAAA